MTLLKSLAATFVLGLFALMPLSVMAAPLPEPAGPVILDVSGTISTTNGDGVARFDLAMIDALPQRTTVTKSPWYDTVQTFEGPLLADLMAAVGASGSVLRLVALNDYAVEIPMQDIRDYPVILATRLEGSLMSVRDKGPLFVIYPFDEAPELFNEVYFSRSIWQLRKIEILP